MKNIANEKIGNPWGIKEIFSFLLGLTSTMPIVGISIGTRDISFFSILFVLAIVYTGMLSCKDGIEFGVASKRMLLWLFIGLISCLCGGFFLENSAPQWSSAAISNIPRVVSLFVFCLFWCSQKSNGQMNDAIVYGFLGGCIANCLWAVIDAGGFYLVGKSINNITFSGYITRHNIRYNSVSLIYSSNGSGFIRSAGFNYDPAHIGLLAPILAGIGLKMKKFSFVIISLCATLASASTTALAAIIIIFLLSFSGFKSKKEIKMWKIYSSFFVITFVIGLIMYFGDVVTIFTKSSFARFFERVSSVYFSNDYGEHNVRTLYLLCLPYAIFEMIPFFLFGSGFGTSSLGYVRSSYAASVIGSPLSVGAYDMENSYIAYLLDTGIVGFLIYVSILISVCKWFWLNMKKNEDNVSIAVFYTVLASAITFAFYHYILFAPEMLMLIVALSIMDKKQRI